MVQFNLRNELYNEALRQRVGSTSKEIAAWVNKLVETALFPHGKEPCTSEIAKAKV